MSIYAWGANNYGQLGTGQTCEQVESPMLLRLPQNVEVSENLKFYGGGGHSFMLDQSTGQVWACGWNHKGQIGLGTSENASEFLPLKLNLPIKTIACGWDFSLLVTIEGKVYGCGSNNFGAIGIGKDKRNAREPTLVPGLKDIVKVRCGLRHSLALDSNGNMYGIGSNKKNQLNLPERTLYWDPTVITELNEVEELACGQYFSLACTKRKKIFAFGENKFGQCGMAKDFEIKIPENSRTIKCVQAGWTHGIAVDDKGTLLSWGRNNYGQLGRASDPWVVDISLHNTRLLATGSEHGIAVDDKGTLLSWGWNEHGNCGNGNTENISLPKPIPGSNGFKKILGIFAASAHNFLVTE